MQPVEKALEAELIVTEWRTNGRGGAELSDILKGYKKEELAAVWLSWAGEKKAERWCCGKPHRKEKQVKWQV